MPISKELRKKVFNKFDGHCAYCGTKIIITEMQIDHIRSRHWFYYGLKSEIPNYHVDDYQNLNPACRFCNGWKKTFSVEQFRAELEEQLRRLNKNSSNFRIAKRYGLITENHIPVVFYFEKVQHLQKLVDARKMFLSNNDAIEHSTLK